MIIDTKFITTTSAKLSTINVVDGQVIALSDQHAWYYDMGGIRHSVKGNVIETALPTSGEPDTLYVLNSGNNQTAGVYIWSGSKFIKISGLDNEKVRTEASDSTKVYLVGSVSSVDGVESLVKNAGIFIDMTTGKSSIGAASADSADMAIADSDGQNINETYIKSITAKKVGKTATFTVTKGDNTISTFTVADSDTVYDVFTGTDGTTDGTTGLVPAPIVGDETKFLASDGTWQAIAAATDTKNTAGGTNLTATKLFLVGSKAQTDQERTYTNQQVYISNTGHVYSHGKQTVNLDDSQSLTNKTYEGYTLGNIVEKSVATEVAAGNEDIPTSDIVNTAIQTILSNAKKYTDKAIGDIVHFGIAVVDELPTTDIKEQTIYLVPNSSGSSDNARTEYMYINGSWEIIGSTDVDLTGYVTETQMNAAIAAAVSAATGSNDTGLSVVNGQLCITYQI